MHFPGGLVLTLYLTGPFRANATTGFAPDNLSGRAQAMLAYLACQPGMRAERGLLADILWADRAGEQARASLRQELAVLRKVLPDGVLDANRQMAWLDPALPKVDTSGSGDWLREMRQTDRPMTTAPFKIEQHDRPSLAVLPFDEIGAASTDMFADGVVEEITGALSRVRDFHVIARQSAFALQDMRITIPEIAAKLGVQYLVEGTVRRSGDKVRITAQLVHGADGRTLWSERFDDRLDDLFDLQDRVAAKIPGQISPSLREAEIRRATAIPPDQQTAYSLSLTRDMSGLCN
ncbi:MAG: hypothetical protein QNL54_14095, partial [Rhodobacterales bacterium]